MELSVREFLDSVGNPSTKKQYRLGMKKFCEWFDKSPREILEMRKNDLTQRPKENIIEYRNRATRFEKMIERFHGHLLTVGYKTNSARLYTVGIRQLFRYYQMPARMRAGSKVNKGVKTSKNFPLCIEHIREMYEVADLRERVVLALATDLGLRISDFIRIKKYDLPRLDQEPPLMFDVETKKTEIVAHGFLSNETVELLKLYLPTLPTTNPYLFPSNTGENKPISSTWVNQLLQKLAAKAGIDTKEKSLSFHCFRKMFLSASIDSGIGLTAGKKLCGKTIPRSDDTYLTTVKLKERFIQLKKFLTIKQKVQPETQEQIEKLDKAVVKLQEDSNTYKTIAETVTEKNRSLEEQMLKMQQIDQETMKEVQKLRQAYQQSMKELKNELEKESMRFSDLQKTVGPLLKKQMKELGRETGKEIRQAQNAK